jgi:lipopolysaccharide export system protein LptA
MCFGLCVFQTVVFMFDGYAQAPAPAMSTPVDIQATEEEFADDQVIARGNVKVTYKDSVVHAPMARLFRDADGQPRHAHF